MEDNFKDSRFGLFTASEIHRLLKGSKKKDEKTTAAAKKKFPVSFFSPGLTPSTGGPTIVDRWLTLNWYLPPGAIVTIEPEYPAGEPVEFAVEILQGNGN